MSEYPEHEKLLLVSDQSQAIGKIHPDDPSLREDGE